MILLLLALITPSWGTCEPPATAPVDFQVRPEVLYGIPVVLELRAESDMVALSRVLAEVEARGARATVAVRPAMVRANAPALQAASERGHELIPWYQAAGMIGSTPEVAAAASTDDWWTAWRVSLRDFKREVGVRPQAALVDQLPRRGETGATQVSKLNTVLLESPLGNPHVAKNVGGQLGSVLILNGGGHGCPGSLVKPNPWSLDAATRAMIGIEALRRPTVRVALATDDMDADEATLLGRWLEEVLLPSGATLTFASQIKPQLASFGRPAEFSEPMWRPVDRTEVLAAAAGLGQPKRLPRELDGLLNLTEAFLAFSQLLGEGEEPLERVALAPLAPPVESARSTLPPEGVDLDPAMVRATARALAPRLKTRVPGVVTVGTHTLTAAEFLVAMAAVLTTPEGPIHVGPVDVPDPWSDGLGWGESTGR